MDLVITVIVGSILLFFALLVIGIMIAKFYRKVEQGKALIVNKMKAEPEVTFTGATVLPIIHKAEVMDISVKTIEIDRRAKDGLICRDNIRADIKVTFFVRVNKTVEDVIKVAQSIGCARASDPLTLEALFSAKFSEGLKTVGKQLDFVDLYTKRHEFRDAIISLIGRDLNGYILEDAAIDYLEQTPIASLDPMNILDAQGIRKITELTSTEHVRTNEFQNTERKLTKKQDVEAAEAILELDRQQADATAKQEREIASVRAREHAELLKIQAEERRRAEVARIATDEELAIAEQNKQRQVEVAEKNRQRVVGIETERVEKDRMLEQVGRERAVALSQIDKEKALEVERKNIQDVIRERVAVERTVVEEQERIKTVQVMEDAKRNRDSIIIAAEAQAQEKLVKDIKAAEAAEQASVHIAKERVTLAEAELEAADREARAKIRLAEGLQAQHAADGLAEAKVKEADAIATEKHGLAEMRVREAEAAAISKVGAAEASVVREKAFAEAEGITHKAEALKQLDVASREHEEFRLRIQMERELGTAQIHARQAVEEAKAQILGTALQNAKIDIVGGDGQFLDRVVNSVGMGKAVDTFLHESETAQAVLERLGVKTPAMVPKSAPKVPVVKAD
ncbi:MAG TPA: flotillin family protein [Thermoanaerobaculia bacterium]|nr:flotillin family protein [Thermoanaerobaculia bacterium]